MKLKNKNKKFQPDSNILASPDECRGQWWILGEVSEAIASGPPFFRVIEGPPFLKMPRVVLFCGILHGFMNLKNSQKFSANR